MKDHIDKDEVSVIYCPTSEMIADFFTKPLQGEIFKQFRHMILGISTPEFK